MRYLFALLLLPALAFASSNWTDENVGLYNFSTFTVTTSTSVPILPRNTKRALLVFQNNGSSSVVIKPGSVPANATDGIVITAGTIYSPVPPMVDAFYAISASSTDKVVMIEGIQ